MKEFNVRQKRQVIHHSVQNPIMGLVVKHVKETLPEMPEPPKVHGELLIGGDGKMGMTIECTGTTESMALIVYHILENHPEVKEMVEGLMAFGGGNEETAEDIPLDGDIDEQRRKFFEQ